MGLLLWGITFEGLRGGGLCASVCWVGVACREEGLGQTAFVFDVRIFYICI